MTNSNRKSHAFNPNAGRRARCVECSQLYERQDMVHGPLPSDPAKTGWSCDDCFDNHIFNSLQLI